MFSLRKQDGIQLYARKVLIQEYCIDLLPEYFRYVQGVVDSEDLPLNVSRESVQSNRVMTQLKKVVTAKIIDTLKTMGKDNPESYEKFWKVYGRSIKGRHRIGYGEFRCVDRIGSFPQRQPAAKMVIP